MDNQRPVVSIVVKNLVVVHREIPTDDKPAGAGKYKSVLVSIAIAYWPYVVSEVEKWMSYLNIS